MGARWNRTHKADVEDARFKGIMHKLCPTCYKMSSQREFAQKIPADALKHDQIAQLTGLVGKVKEKNLANF